MHVADSTMFYTADSGGVRTYLNAKRAQFAARPGIRHSLVVPAARTGHDGDLIHVAAPPLPFGQGYRFPLDRRAWADALVELSPDLIEAGDPYRAAWSALDAGRRLDAPVLAFCHSDLPRLLATRFGRLSARAAEAYVARLYRRFDRVLAPSRVMADKLLRLGVGNVHVQPLGVDLDRFHPRHRDPAFREELGLTDNTRLLVFAGRGAREKNLPDLLAAVQRLGPRYHLLLIGPDMPSRLPDNASTLCGYRPPLAVARALASSDALVHAGDQETFGLVVLEAMASGLPVVGVQAGAVAELVGVGCGLLAEPRNPQQFAERVAELFANDAGAMGRHARHVAERHYSWSRVVDGLLEHYADLLGAPPRRAAANG